MSFVLFDKTSRFSLIIQKMGSQSADILHYIQQQ